MSDLYDEDILLWSEHQAELLCCLAAGEPVDERPDWANIIEEVERVGRAQLHAVESLLLQALLHMLKTEGWPRARNVETGLADAHGFRVQAQAAFRALDAVEHRFCGYIRGCAEGIAGADGRAAAATGCLGLSDDVRRAAGRLA